MAQKKYGGAPFGIQTARFDVSGVHPQNKMPGTYTQVPYCKRATSNESKLRGPGAYSIETGTFTVRAMEEKLKGPNWERAQDVAKMAAMPHVLYKNQWEHKKELSELMGPGKYTVKDFVEEMTNKPSSSRGACQTLDTRLSKENKMQRSLPGPGVYGKGGVPWAAIDERSKQSMSTVGGLDSGGSALPHSTGSGLPPGLYQTPSSIQTLLDKSVSKRGPYDLSTGERYKMTKKLAQTRNMFPGKYELKRFTDNFEDHHHKRHGRFPTLPLCPEPPTERIYCNTLSQCYRRKADPGPGYYESGRRGRCKSAPASHYPFDSSTNRLQQHLSRTKNPVGTGQYDVNRCHDSRHVNANVSVFTSGTPRLPVKGHSSSRELLLNERLHPRNSTRQLLVPAGKTPF